MKTKLTLLLLLITYSSLLAQTTLFSENMGNPSGTTTIGANTFQNYGTLTYSNGGQPTAADVRITSASSGYSVASGAGNVFFTNTSGAYGFSIEGINASNYASLTLQYSYKKESASAQATFSVDYWNGSSWVTLANSSTSLFNEVATATAVWYLAKTLTLPTAAQINGLKIRFVKTGTTAIRIDDVKLTGTLQVSPTVINSTATDVTNNSVTFGGNVTATGGSAIASTGTVYVVTSTNSDPIVGGTGVVSLNTPSPNSGTGTFSNSSGAVLLYNVQYSYNAFAIKSSGAIGYGTVGSFYTLAVTPAAPFVTNPSSNSLTITIGSDSNSNSTTYAIFESSTNTYVQSNGSLGASAVYQTAATWGNKIVTGLTPTSNYTFQTIAKNGAGITTLAGSSTTGTTLVPNSTSSDILFNTSSSTSDNTNINYSAYQVASITSTVNSVGVMGFYLRDGGATHNDADNLATELTAISFNVTNGSSIRSARLFVGNSPKGISVSVVNNTISFTGLNGIIAADNSQLAINLRVTFNTTVTDNQQMQFTINSVTANSTGSQFASADAGGATSSIAGDINRLEVVATKLAFLQQPPASLYAGTSMSPAPSITAKDGLENVDLDFTGIVTLSSSGNLNIPLTSATVAGIVTLTYFIMDFSQSGTGYTITASANGLNPAISNAFNVMASPEIVLQNLPPATCQINNCNLVPNGDFEEFSQLPDAISQIQNACGWYSAYATPELFNTASTNSSGVSIPCNFIGGQTCNFGLGSGYAGIFYAGQRGEVIVSRLSSPLVAGQNYQLSFDVSLAEGMSSFSKTIQAYLSPTTITISPNVPIVINNPQMLFSNSTTSTTSNGWETLTFTFTSTGGLEEYIYLGGLNVINQPNTPATDPTCFYSSFWNNASFAPAQYAYYYIDNVKLVPLNIIDAVDDDYSLSPIDTLIGGTTASVFTNDTINGVAATGSTVIPSIISVTPAMSPLPTIDANGIITIPAGAAIGTYTIVYKIVDSCSNNFDTASVTIVVAPTITNCLKIGLETFCYNASQSQTTLNSVFNDSASCGAIAMIGNMPCDSSNVTIEMITPLANGCTFNTDGTITIAAGTMPFKGESLYQLRSIQFPSITSVPLIVHYGILEKVNPNYISIFLHAGSPPYDVYSNNSVNILTSPIVSTINPNIDGNCGLINSVPGSSSTSNTVTIIETTNPQNPYYQIDESNGFVKFRQGYNSTNNIPPAPTLPNRYYLLTYSMCINNTAPLLFCNDGEVTILYYYTNFREMQHAKEENNLIIYPNPSSDGAFTLVFDKEINDGTLVVYNLLGQKMKQEKLDNAKEYLLDINSAPTGTYMLKIHYGEQELVKRIVIK